MKSPPRSNATRKRKILIVDDHSVVREGLATVVNQQPDLMVCAQAEGAAQAMAAAAELKPDVAVLVPLWTVISICLDTFGMLIGYRNRQGARNRTQMSL